MQYGSFVVFRSINRESDVAEGQPTILSSVGAKGKNMNIQTVGSSNRIVPPPQGVWSQEKREFDIPELKRQAGLTPFSNRVEIDDQGYSACPFHDGDSDKSFHVLEKEDGFIGT